MRWPTYIVVGFNTPGVRKAGGRARVACSSSPVPIHRAQWEYSPRWNLRRSPCARGRRGVEEEEEEEGEWGKHQSQKKLGVPTTKICVLLPLTCFGAMAVASCFRAPAEAEAPAPMASPPPDPPCATRKGRRACCFDILEGVEPSEYCDIFAHRESYIVESSCLTHYATFLNGALHPVMS